MTSLRHFPAGYGQIWGVFRKGQTILFRQIQKYFERFRTSQAETWPQSDVTFEKNNSRKATFDDVI